MVIAFITAMFLASAISGVNKGIKLLSSVNTCIAILLLALTFIVGPKIPILNTLVHSTGQHIQYFISDVTMINAFGDNEWIMNWRVFYYAWFIAWCPFVGMFIARISKGRTVREFIVGAVIAPTIFTIIWLSVFGTLALNVSGEWSLSELANIVASPETAVFIVFEKYPLSKVLSVLVIILLAVFFVTSADSATFSLSMMTSNGDMEPPKYKKVVWAVIEASIAYLLLSAGSLKPLQTLSIAASLPFLFVMIAICFALIRDIKKDCKIK
jgi:glycine betaine transporter